MRYSLIRRKKLVVAYHEIGHAIGSSKAEQILLRCRRLQLFQGHPAHLDIRCRWTQGDKYLMTKEEIENKIATFTGGRAAEEIIFGQITTGASNDIEQATKLARAMITRYGMSEDFDMVAMETVNNQYLGGDASLACSADTQKEIDRMVVELVKKEHEKAKDILTENRKKLDELAQFLYEKETITGDEFMTILNKVEENSYNQL